MVPYTFASLSIKSEPVSTICAFVELGRSLYPGGLARGASRQAGGAVNTLSFVPVEGETSVAGLTEEVVGRVEGLAAGDGRGGQASVEMGDPAVHTGNTVVLGNSVCAMLDCSLILASSLSIHIVISNTFSA